MQLFYEPVVQPLIEILDARVILEVGEDSGVDAALLGASCAAQGRTLLSLQPELKPLRANGFLLPHAEPWQRMEQLEQPVDLALFTGDNTATSVSLQLQQLRTHCQRLGHRFPLVVVHDRAAHNALTATVEGFCSSTHREVGFELVSGTRQLAVLFAESLRRDNLHLAQFLHGLPGLVASRSGELATRTPAIESRDALRRRFEYLQAATKLARLQYEDSLAIGGGPVPDVGSEPSLRTALAERDAWRNYALTLRDPVRSPVSARRASASSALAQPSPPCRPWELAAVEESPVRLPRPIGSEPNANAASLPKASGDQVQVVVCVHNALDEAKLCLASVERHLEPGVGLVLVDDGSSAETKAYLQKWVAERRHFAELQDHPINRGYTAAVNTGLRSTTASFVILLNSDTVVTQRWVSKLLDCAQSDPSIGIVGPLSNAASWQNVPELLDRSGKFAINELPKGYSVDRFAQFVQDTSVRAWPQVPFVNGFCFLIRRDVLDAVGEFDVESFPRGYGEENDFCLRAAAAGFRMAIADDTFVYHAKSKSFGHAQRTELSQLGKQALEAKHGVGFVQAQVRAIRRNSDLLQVRSRIVSALGSTDAANRASALPAGPPTARPAAPATEQQPQGGAAMARSNGPEPPERIVFLLLVSGGGGGAHSVVQEASAMRALGADAKVAVRPQHLQQYLKQYEALPCCGDLFLAVPPQAVESVGADSSVVVATLFSSVAILERICARYPHVTPAYYIQDYEPYFFQPDSAEAKEAAASYARVKDAVLFAKTWWVVDTVGKQHDVFVHKVRPSVDRELFVPGQKSEQASVCIAAMIRPSTPRRGAERTVLILQRLKRQLGEGVTFQLFGCDPGHAVLGSLPREQGVNCHGKITRTEVADIFAKADIVVDFSDYQAFGRTGLEAMACGCAVINPLRGGTSEYCVHLDNSLLVDTSSNDACYQALVQLVQDASLRRKIATRGLRTARSYSTESAAKSELALLIQEAQRFRRDETKRGLWTAEAIAQRRASLDEDQLALTPLQAVLPGKPIAPDALFKRRLRKLVRDPKQFFADSRLPFAKKLSGDFAEDGEGRAVPGQAEPTSAATVALAIQSPPPAPAGPSVVKRKLNKLLRDPRQFMADSKLPMARRVAKSSRLWR